MATSNYKVLTDVDLSKNKIFNITEIRNDDSENNLTIHTAGDTSVNADNLTESVTGTTSLTTSKKFDKVTATAEETVTTSKKVTVANTTIETINSTGVTLETPKR